MTDERRRSDDHIGAQLEKIATGVNEMKTALFGPAYDPKMGFIYRTESRLSEQEKKVEDLERAHWKQIGIVAGVLGCIELAWNWLKGH